MPIIWNGNMFGDLDCPLNASRGLSTIAEFPACWVCVCQMEICITFNI